MQPDRRQYIRYSIQSNAMALVVPGPDAFVSLFSNRILDISEGGLAFSYVGHAALPTAGYFLEIVDQSFHLDKVPVTVVSDSPLHPDYGSIRRCGLKFNRLTRDQKDKILHFIKSHAVQHA